MTQFSHCLGGEPSEGWIQAFADLALQEGLGPNPPEPGQGLGIQSTPHAQTMSKANINWALTRVLGAARSTLHPLSYLLLTITMSHGHH